MWRRTVGSGAARQGPEMMGGVRLTWFQVARRTGKSRGCVWERLPSPQSSWARSIQPAVSGTIWGWLAVGRLAKFSNAGTCLRGGSRRRRDRGRIGAAVSLRCGREPGTALDLTVVVDALSKIVGGSRQDEKHPTRWGHRAIDRQTSDWTPFPTQCLPMPQQGSAGGTASSGPSVPLLSLLVPSWTGAKRSLRRFFFSS
jgi:hypothetical protein